MTESKGKIKNARRMLNEVKKTWMSKLGAVRTQQSQG